MQIALPLAMGTAGLAAGQWGAGAMVRTVCADAILHVAAYSAHDLQADGRCFNLQGLVLASLAAFVFYLW